MIKLICSELINHKGGKGTFFCTAIMDYNTYSDVLQDININSGKENKWKAHKVDSLLLADSYFRQGSCKKANRVSECADIVSFKRFDDGVRKLHQVSFCKVRLCPMCAWRRSLKIFGQVSKVMDKLQEVNSYDFIFLTLTTKNVSTDEELDSTIDKLFYAFNKLTKRKEFKTSVKGYFRALEVSYIGNGFHPHFHCVLVVNSSYFTDKDYYISQKRWAELWQKCLNIDYIPIVDVRKFRESKKGKGKEVAEVAKYAVKAKDYLIFDNPKSNQHTIDLEPNKYFTDYLVGIFDRVLANRRLIAFGGVMKDIHKQLNLDDVSDGDLINLDGDEQLRADLHYIIEVYKWGVGAVGKNYYKFDEYEPQDGETSASERR